MPFYVAMIHAKPRYRKSHLERAVAIYNQHLVETKSNLAPIKWTPGHTAVGTNPPATAKGQTASTSPASAGSGGASGIPLGESETRMPLIDIIDHVHALIQREGGILRDTRYAGTRPLPTAMRKKGVSTPYKFADIATVTFVSGPQLPNLLRREAGALQSVLRVNVFKDDDLLLLPNADVKREQEFVFKKATESTSTTTTTTAGEAASATAE